MPIIQRWSYMKNKEIDVNKKGRQGQDHQRRQGKRVHRQEGRKGGECRV
jgi:hypothetical protein